MSGIKMSLYLNYGPRREQTVSYAPGDNQSREGERTPMIKITNRLLLESGFQVGSKFEIQYGNNVLTITKVNEQIHDYAHSPKQPLAIQAGSRFTIGEAGLLHSAHPTKA